MAHRGNERNVKKQVYDNRSKIDNLYHFCNADNNDGNVDEVEKNFSGEHILTSLNQLCNKYGYPVPEFSISK